MRSTPLNGPAPDDGPACGEGGLRMKTDQDYARVVEHAASSAVLPHRSFVMPHAPVVAYVTEEVSRQGHDVESLDGLQRVGFMLSAWTLALLWHGPITATTVIELGQRIEPSKNTSGLRRCGVRVGDRVCPAFAKVPQMLADLLERQNAMAPLEFYREFEKIHPFVDGNGRTGKILLNWLNGTLLDPVFPPSNLWGREIRNP